MKNKHTLSDFTKYLQNTFNDFRFCGFVKVLILAHCSSDTATKFKCVCSDKCVLKAVGFNLLLLTATCYVGNENFGFIM